MWLFFAEFFRWILLALEQHRDRQDIHENPRVWSSAVLRWPSSLDSERGLSSDVGLLPSRNERKATQKDMPLLHE